MTHRSRSIVSVSILALLAVLFYTLYASQTFAENRGNQIRVRWLLSHQPTDVFTRAASTFAEELSQKTNGRLVLQVVTPQDLGLSATGDVPSDTVFRLLGEGKVELATDYTVPLAKSDPAFAAVNLPYLFDSYSTLSSVLDGKAGDMILNSLSSVSSAHALAFTMSGGFRILATKTPILSAEDLVGKRIVTSGGPVAEATLKAFDAIPVSMDLEKGPQNLGVVDGVEVTYSRLSSVLDTHAEYKRYIAETNHSVFLTAILADSKFYESLSASDQSALTAAAREAAKIEREDSIALGERTKAALIQSGTSVTNITPATTAALKAKTSGVYSTFKSEIGSELIDALLSR